jgi:hypothetical protein
MASYRIDKKGFRLLVRYKCNSTNLFQPVPTRDLSTVGDWSTESLREYAEELRCGYVSSKRCYEGRVGFRDRYVPPARRDEKHEKAIQAAKSRCAQFLQRLTEVTSLGPRHSPYYVHRSLTYTHAASWSRNSPTKGSDH